MHYLGLDIGYSAIKLAVLDARFQVVHSEYLLHRGGVAEALEAMIVRLRRHPCAADITHGAVTGSGSAFLTTGQAVSRVNEVAAIVEGSLSLAPNCASIIEIGGQTAKFIAGVSSRNKANLEISMNSNCSSGTGSFLEEQVSRLDMDIEEYSPVAARATFTPRIAGRCSVFAKTDITHHQQEGVPIADILAGLAHSVARNYKSSVMRRSPRNPPMLFVGGVSRNQAIHRALENVLGLGPDQLLVSEHSAIAGAVGAAIFAAADGLPLNIGRIDAALEKPSTLHIHLEEGVVLQPLAQFDHNDAANKHNSHPLPGNRPAACWLGIDVGSTSTNLVLVDGVNNIVDHRYLRTAGDPVRAVRTGLAELRERFGGAISIKGVGTTGSGRYTIGRLVGADVIRDEITAQARAAVAIDPTVDTIFEIGGQDSKFIALDNGAVSDFQMNKICAAGTGSFIEEQCKKLGVPLEEIGPMALRGETPANLGERCTVFMEASIGAHLALGADRENLAAGLCYSIVKNYMNRVVGPKRVGGNIFLQGGVAYNQGVIGAFRAVTGKNVTVPPFFSVTGALGAAILTHEEMGTGPTTFRGFDPQFQEVAAQEPSAPQPALSTFNQHVQDFIFGDYDGTLDPTRKTVGIPRALFTFGMFPMFHPFFKELGFNVLLSEPTSEQTIQRAQEYSLDETCYPVKLVNGHAAELVEKNVDYLFFPDMYTVYHPASKSRRDYGCAYMQLAFKIINKAMDLKNRGISLLAPTIAFSLGQGFMRDTFMNLGRQLGKNEQETGMAMQKAMQGIHAFQKRIEERGRETIANLNPERKTFVLISKIYGITDPVLNLGIPDKLEKMGYQTLPFYDTPEVDIFRDHPNMYWPFAQHILGAARLTAEHPNLYAVFLTHHGCGPDTVTAHYFKQIMGHKPYLTIEVDEHSSAVGVTTRIEAFVNSLGRRRIRPAGPVEQYTSLPPGPPVDIRTDIAHPSRGTLLLPRLYPYSRIVCETLRAAGVDAEELHETSDASIDRGRQHTVTNEYYSLAALLGDALLTLDHAPDHGAGNTLLALQNEGAEVDGQYARFLRTKLDENGLENVGILAPFIEDLPRMLAEHAEPVSLCLLAGDLVLCAPRNQRSNILQAILAMIRGHALNPDALREMARNVRGLAQHHNGARTVLAVGEPSVLYNDILNDNTLEELERANHTVVYTPFSEYLESIWNDHALQYGDETRDETRDETTDQRSNILHSLGRLKAAQAKELGPVSPYACDKQNLMDSADTSLGYYAGAFGRYRAAKPVCCPQRVQGVITVSSMYENTGISLGVLQEKPENGTGLPVLDLTFDGTRNENDRTKIESFIHYLNSTEG